MEMEKHEEALECVDEGLKIDRTNTHLWKNKFCALLNWTD